MGRLETGLGAGRLAGWPGWSGSVASASLILYIFICGRHGTEVWDAWKPDWGLAGWLAGWPGWLAGWAGWLVWLGG